MTDINVFYLQYCFEDLDECSVGTHDCQGSSMCNNTYGGFNCTCLPGFRYNGIDCWGKIHYNTEENTQLKKNNTLSGET